MYPILIVRIAHVLDVLIFLRCNYPPATILTPSSFPNSLLFSIATQIRSTKSPSHRLVTLTCLCFGLSNALCGYHLAPFHDNWSDSLSKNTSSVTTITHFLFNVNPNFFIFARPLSLTYFNLRRWSCPLR